jgi:hypothetical protein
MSKLPKGSVQLLHRRWEPPPRTAEGLAKQKEEYLYFNSEDGIDIHLITVEQVASSTTPTTKYETISKDLKNHRAWYWMHLLGFYVREEGIFFVEILNKA